MCRGGRWALVSVVLALTAVAHAIPSFSKFQQRTAAFGMGAVGGSTPAASKVLQPTGTGISDHPLFESLYVGEPDRVVATTRYGKVTARDLYLFLIVSQSKTPAFILEKYDKEKSPAERDKLGESVRKAIDDYVFVNLIVPRLAAKEPWNDVDEARAQMTAHEAYRFVYVASVVRSKIHITDADRVKYLQEHRNEIAAPERWRIRYIFMRSEETDPLEQQDVVQKRLEDLRQDILRGKIDFPEAARQFSQAPSAANGGEVPPFRRGEIFFYLEDAVSRLQPGEVSEVIRGPHGFYLVQLIETLPAEELSLDNPIQAGKVEEGLTRQVMRAQYLWDLRVLLEEKRRPVLDMHPWDEKRPDDVVGEVAGYRLTKGQLLNIFPTIESDDLAPKEPAVEYTLRRVLEGEAIAQAVREAGAEDSVFLRPMLEMAHNLAALEKLKEELSCQLKPSAEVVRRFWRSHPELFTPLPMKRVVEVTLTPLNTSSVQEQTIAELERALAEGGGESRSPLIPAEPEAVIPDAAEITGETTASAAAEAGQTSSTLGGETTSTTTLSADAPTTGVSGADAVTTSAAAGGAGPQSPAAGGVRSKSVATTRSRTLLAAAQTTASTSGGTWVGPLGFSSEPQPEVRPLHPREGVWVRPTIHSRRISPTRLREIVQSYHSSDWQLSYRDLGYVYVEDHPELPPEVAGLAVGDYLPPKFSDGKAVTYCVEDAKRPPTPTFAEIESYAYRVWRDVEIDRKLESLRRKELEKARVDYQFQTQSNTNGNLGSESAVKP
jgi:parvulin-like peptidyl-prolyl isomerase